MGALSTGQALSEAAQIGTMSLREPITRSQVCLSDTHKSLPNRTKCQEGGLNPHPGSRRPLKAGGHLPAALTTYLPVAPRSCGPCLLLGAPRSATSSPSGSESPRFLWLLQSGWRVRGGGWGWG